MHHKKLLKYPKRFCAVCDSNQYVFIVPHKKFDMYHCHTCLEEVCRTGDGQQPKQNRQVLGGLDVGSFYGLVLDGKSSEELACERPDVLSDEHRFWPVQDEDADLSKNVLALAFRLGYSRLTPRQRQVVAAIDKASTQENAARLLGVSRGTITSTLKQIQKKLMKSIYNSGKTGQQGKGV